MKDFLDWFITNTHGSHYSSLWSSLNGDHFWGWLIIILCLLIVVGHTFIACYWFKNLKLLKSGIVKNALKNGVSVFLLSVIVGYSFTVLKMWWPAWKLETFGLILVNILTWRYALDKSQMNVIYEQIHRTAPLNDELDKCRKIIQNITEAIEKDIEEPLEKISEDIYIGAKEENQSKLIKAREKLLQIEASVKTILQTCRTS